MQGDSLQIQSHKLCHNRTVFAQAPYHSQGILFIPRIYCFYVRKALAPVEAPGTVNFSEFAGVRLHCSISFPSQFVRYGRKLYLTSPKASYFSGAPELSVPVQFHFLHLTNDSGKRT